jgi:TolA-binding protein
MRHFDRSITAVCPALFGALTLMLLSGCASAGHLAEVELRVKALELERQQLDAQMEQDVSRLTNLHGMLTQAEATLRRSGVKLGIRMEQVEDSLPALKGEVEALSFRLTSAGHALEVVKRELFDRLGASAVYLPADLPKEPNGVFAMAQKRQKADKPREARALFDYFEASFPDDPRADDALMAIGTTLEGSGDVSAAIKIYQRIHDSYGEGDQVSKALWRIGELFLAREDCGRANSVFDYLAQSYATTSEGKDAAMKISEISKTCGAED